MLPVPDLARIIECFAISGIPTGNFMDVSVVIPLYNQLSYTRICLESLFADYSLIGRTVVIDNGSSDGTAEYLAARSDLHVITNPVNMGCAAAWNQGVKATQTQWVVILNNDVILSPGWLAGMIEFANLDKLDIVSPAFREGEYNYDISDYSGAFVQRMAAVSRKGVAQGVCFMVRRQVFETIGYFDENFRIGQFEDADFFRRAKSAGFRLGTTGRSFIHHFGSITQNSIRRNRVVRPYEAENRAYYRRKWNLTWWSRLLERRSAKLQAFVWSTRERTLHGHSLVEKWIDGRLRYY